MKRSEKFVKMRLYVAGHTDTVGPSAKNRKLSLDRARAIAQYFKKHGVALPIAYAGFGEDVLKVPTKDNVDEARTGARTTCSARSAHLRRSRGRTPRHTRAGPT